ncbi:hypothetical protein NECAME_08984 [Necator americanus]|uniref:Uncharacterized protein n=1 Tax=Necator americanus TaxID=51031 RepID=W2TFY6_NECAM|nr:hypothetical protein NECAME_08984 [Necator americanus]ETN80743.1 hypothetical protein NECAME_08984 [Necator americanus]
MYNYWMLLQEWIVEQATIQDKNIYTQLTTRTSGPVVNPSPPSMELCSSFYDDLWLQGCPQHLKSTGFLVFR